MTQKCIKVVCDRCGETVYVKNLPTDISASELSDDKRWDLASYSKYNYDLCPECAREYENVMHRYWMRRAQQ